MGYVCVKFIKTGMFVIKPEFCYSHLSHLLIFRDCAISKQNVLATELGIFIFMYVMMSHN